MQENPSQDMNFMHVDHQHPQTFTPSEYKSKVYEAAMKRNTIAILDTCEEKTMIAVMLINEIAKSLNLECSNLKKIIVFLAPSVHLVRQQCEVLKGHLHLRVGEYYGALRVDDWNMESWDKEVEENDVFVMTPQILLDALRKAFLCFEAICLLVVDECHHAVGNHPYAKIMEDFYHKLRKRPKIFGTIASAVIRKGDTSVKDHEVQISELELLMDSQIYDSDATINREPATVLKPCSEKITDAYTVEVTGASVSADSSINLVNEYCNKLPKDESLSPKPRFRYLLEGHSYKCKMTLPPNAAFQTIIGPEASNANLSKQLVCLGACKKLHNLGALDDYLLPSIELLSGNDSLADHKASVSGARAGTTKRKELHGVATVNSLSGCWGDKLDRIPFHAYKIEFSCSIEEIFSCFILFLEDKLDDDVGNVEVELFLVSKFVKTYVSYGGQIFLDAEQVSKAKKFHELFFNGLFGKLFIKLSGERQFLLKTEESLWDQSNMYLLLPMEASEKATNESWKVNWMAVESCFLTVNFLKENAWLSSKQSESSRADSFLSRAVKDDYMNTKVVHLANTSIHINDLKGMVVIGIHTGRIYSVFDAIDNSSARSPFDGNDGSVPSSYSSFADYFKTKYGIVLLLPSQPLLLLKQTHNPFNLLVDFKKEGVSTIKRSKGDPKPVGGKGQNHVHMPPELLIKVDVRRDILKSFYLLPSLMHRMESLMLASQLRKQISCQSSGFHIPISLILGALTTLRCNESFSMERLELLGDSILKYTISCHLFLKYPKLHEGQLSSRRSSAVCNSTLHKLGTARNLQVYIRDGAFEPRRWTAPGQRSIRLSQCDHGVDTLEVPLHLKKTTEDAKIVIGKCCDRGHRWMGSKTISDCVEALIGAYYVGGGLIAALQLMKWFSIEAEVEPFLVEEAIKRASLHSWTLKANVIETLESKIGYKFTVKGLLLEAITHGAEQEKDGGYSYQRLEFLGDAVLDILITWHLYQNHEDMDPGELTDLRSASVNNENFALAAVRHDLHPHLQNCSGFLESQIHSFAQMVSNYGGNINPLQGGKSPKVLGDLVESIVGAMLIDTKLNLDEIWKIVEPILSPIVTPDMLELPPLRELIELCDSLGYFIKEDCSTDGEMVHAELKLQLKDALLVSEGIGQTKKMAKGQAALQLLNQLETRGISSSKKRKLKMDLSSSLSEDSQIDSKINDDISKSRKKQKLSLSREDRITDATPQASDSENLDNPEIPPINMRKGGPRTAIYDLCKRVQWPMPSFQTTEEKSRVPIEFDDGFEKKSGFCSFVSVITLTIPEVGTIEVSGDKRADKKSSYDSAAVNMLHELAQRGKITIKS